MSLLLNRLLTRSAWRDWFYGPTPGACGVLIVEPWLRPDQWVAGHVQVLDQEVDGVRLLRMTTSRVDGSQSILDMHYLVASPSGIEHLVETHRMTLFTLSEYESAFLASNLTFEFDQVGPIGRGALIGLASQNRLQRSTVLPIGR